MTEKIDPMMKRILLFLADRRCVLTEKRPGSCLGLGERRPGIKAQHFLLTKSETFDLIKGEGPC